MIPSIYSFTKALLMPAESFTRLHDACPATDDSGMPRIQRTSRFAEAEIGWKDARWLLCMPLTSAAIPEIERIAALLKTRRSEWLADYRLLRSEMKYEDSTGTAHRCDLVLQYLPAGCTFSEALGSEQPETLLCALDALESELQRLGISHRNLKPENLRWSNGRLIPVRYHHARQGAGDDAEALDVLRSEVLRTTNSRQTAHDVQAVYGNPCDRFPGHLWVGNTHEQLTAVEDEAGIGYVDTSNRIVIPPQFRWGDDFHEGRAAVETAEGMGLIDKQGRYIIPPCYQIVEYESATGRSEVQANGLWAEFDYLGNQLTDFK